MVTLSLVGLTSAWPNPTWAQDPPPRLARLDARACTRAGDGGRALIQALQLETTSVPEVRVTSDEGAPTESEPQTYSAERTEPSLEITACDLRSGSLKVHVAKSPTSHQTQRLDLRQVPVIARPRTAAVVLLEWARSLLNDGGSLPAAHESPPAEAAPTAFDAPIDSDSPEPIKPEVPTAGVPARPPRWVIETGLGFQMTHAPTPVAPRLDALLDILLVSGLRGSVGLHGSYLEPDERYSDVSAWWWGAELGLGYAWGPRAEISLWSVTSFDAISMGGTNDFDEEGARKVRPVVSVSGRFKARTMFDSGLVLGVAVDAGWFIQGARFTTLGEPSIDLSGFRGASRVFIGYGF